MNLIKKETDHYNFEPAWATPLGANKISTNIPEIDHLNLDRIKKKSIDPDSGYGWSIEFAEEVGELYKVFLFLCKEYPNEVIVPTREVDEFWHLHILDTRNYISDCEKIFSTYLHHFPYAGLEGTKATQSEENQFIENTMKLVQRHFPEVLEDDFHASK